MRASLPWCAALAFAALPAAQAHDHPPGAGGAPASAKVVLSAAPLLDQDGKRVQLAKDVIGERIAVVNFVYTTCTTVCPVSSATMAQLYQKPGPALAQDLVLVSFTVDPLRDTPARLREHAARWQAGEGWIWLTGAKRDVDAALKGFGAYTPSFEDHPAMIMIGDASAKRWTRLLGFASVEQISASIEALRAERRRAAHSH